MSKKQFGVVVFPGSNCDADCLYVLRDIIGCPTQAIWHKTSDLSNIDALVLPGGFSYGDYLRAGSIARFSPIMKSVIDFAKQGKPVIGICNGFQILLESGLLPGAMLRNESLYFECSYVNLKVESTNSPFTKTYQKGEILNIPVAHGEGNYFADSDTLKALQDEDRIILRYKNNPNGSIDDIAGICNKERNVFGLMPHPERASEKVLGSDDGKRMFESIVESLS